MNGMLLIHNLLLQGRAAMPVEDIVALYASLVNLALKCYPSRIDYVSKTLGCCLDALKKRDLTKSGIIITSIACIP